MRNFCGISQHYPELCAPVPKSKIKRVTLENSSGDAGKNKLYPKRAKQDSASVSTKPYQFLDSLISSVSWSPEWIQEPHFWVGHMPFAYWLMGEIRPKVFVELGTHSGNSYFSFCQAVREKGLNTRCYAVDTWQGDQHTGNYGEQVFELVNRHNEGQYKLFSTLYRMTFDEALEQFNDRSVDLLHIDGCHTYEAVRHDFVSWFPKLAPGALVLFHDIKVIHKEFGAWKLWAELKEKYPENFEFRQSHGLGVIKLPGSNWDGDRPWLREGTAEKKTLLGAMTANGESLMVKVRNKELERMASTAQTKVDQPKIEKPLNLELFFAQEGKKLSEEQRIFEPALCRENEISKIKIQLQGEAARSVFWRIDLGWEACLIRIHEVGFRGKNGKNIWRLTDHADEVVIGGTAERLKDDDFVILSFGVDPQVILPKLQLLPGEELYEIQITLEILNTNDYLPFLAGQRHELESKSRSALTKASAALEQKEKEAARMQSILIEKDKEIAQATKIDQKIEQIREGMEQDRKECKLVLKKVEKERAISEKQSVILQNSLSQIRQDMAADREEKLKQLHATQQELEHGNSFMGSRIDDVGQYARNIHQTMVGPGSVWMPAPFSWYAMLHKALKIKKPSWLKNNSFLPATPTRPGFWRRLERSIRKRRKRWTAGIGFDRDWYLQEYQDVATAGIDPLEHYQNHGINEGRFKNKKQENKFRILNTNKSTSEKSGAKTYDNLYSNPDSVLQSRIPRIEFDPLLSLPVPYQKNSAINPSIKLIAFYLPQFHPFHENDIWWGKGFTEWTNVGRALPNFSGHYQPHCPIHLGYYDLRVPSVMEEQVALAKNYGIYGFNYYFYWFAGKTLMEAPLQAMLKSKKIDMPFCLTWANENWTRKWDGLERDILIAQKHSAEDSQAFIRHLFQYFRDPRYITISGKPILIVYRPDIIPQIKATAGLWRSEMTKAGFTGIYLMSAQTFGGTSPEPFGFDAAVEFPPHTSVSGSIVQECKDVRPDFKGVVFSYEQAASTAIQTSEPPYKRFRTAMLSWDNTARNQNASHVFHGFSLQRYKQWLTSLCTSCFSAGKYSADEKLVFINAWNEWAEGTHLEPDQKYGYGYLHVTREVVQQFDMSSLSALSCGPVIKTSDLAVVAHVHYEDVWPELNRHIQIAFPKGCDLFVTVTSTRSAAVVRRDFPKAYIILVENRGRDILPFLKMFKMIHSSGHTAICKVHTKKSPYREDGDKLRHGLLDKLLGSSGNVGRVAEMFAADESLGLLCPAEFLLPHTDHNMTFDHEVVSCVADLLKLRFKYSLFPAGSMFWFRPEALLKLTMLEDTLFPPESGWADGTPAHAVERIFGVVAQSSGFTLKSL